MVPRDPPAAAENKEGASRGEPLRSLKTRGSYQVHVVLVGVESPAPKPLNLRLSLGRRQTARSLARVGVREVRDAEGSDRDGKTLTLRDPHVRPSSLGGRVARIVPLRSLLPHPGSTATLPAALLRRLRIGKTIRSSELMPLERGGPRQGPSRFCRGQEKLDQDVSEMRHRRIHGVEVMQDIGRFPQFLV